jgi:menaquinone-dependent protoporphyrinogen oxidase
MPASTGATREIAEGLRAAGQPANAPPVQEAGVLADYEGFVIGGAADSTYWLKDPPQFVRRNRNLLATTKAPTTCTSRSRMRST